MPAAPQASFEEVEINERDSVEVNKAKKSRSGDFGYRRAKAIGNLRVAQTPRLDTTISHTIELLAPYTKRLYPGRYSIVHDVIGRKVTWKAVEFWRRDPTLTPVATLQRFEDALREKAAAEIECANELRAIRLQKQQKPPRGRNRNQLDEWRNARVKRASEAGEIS